MTYKGAIKNEKLAKKIFEQVVYACIEMQKIGILHRDIKDENILMDEKTHKVQ